MFAYTPLIGVDDEHILAFELYSQKASIIHCHSMIEKGKLEAHTFDDTSRSES